MLFGGHHGDGKLRRTLSDRADGVEAVRAGHVEIQEQQVEMLVFRDECERGRSVGSLDEMRSRPECLQRSAQRCAHDRMIVCDGDERSRWNAIVNHLGPVSG
jgi:hypothetical protein